MRRLHIASVLSLAGAALFVTSLAAQETGAGQCEQKAASEVISIVICPEDLSLEQLAGAGKTFAISAYLAVLGSGLIKLQHPKKHPKTMTD